MELVARLKSLATDNWRRTLVVTASVALVLLIAITLAKLVWLVVDGPVAVPAAGAVAADARPTPPARRYSPDSAREWRLFGDAAAPAAAGGESALVTNLPLQLLGTFSTGDDRLSGAVIAERGKDGELYRIGTAVPGGATLEKVEADKVLLRRRGQLETLKFDAAPTGMPAGDDAKGFNVSASMDAMKARLGRPPDDDGSSEAGDAAAGARGLLSNLAQDLKSNPDGVLNELGLKPAGGGNGYLVGEGSSSDAMRNLGLRPGDVVLSVNGKPLGNVQNDTRLVDEVKASGEARVEIRRGTQTFTVNYPL